MLQAHSLLWHYLWVTPNVLLLILALLLWQRRLHERYTLFVVFAVATGIEQLTVYATDVMPAVSAEAWWQVFWTGLVIEGVVKFALVGEVFSQAFNNYSSVAKLGKFLIRGVGIILVLTAAVAAAYAPEDSLFGIVSGAHRLEQTIYLIETGLLVFIFVFSAYFNVRLTRPIFGIALGLSISACVHLATWGIAANGGLPPSKRVILDFLNMATYHVCVLVWFYYLLVSRNEAPKSAAPLPENNLELWNRELERLVHL
jgi:hypothetical protein